VHPHLADELAALGQLTVSGLRARYTELFGEETRVGNKVWLIRRIAWRLQALAEGDCPSAPVNVPLNWPTMPTCVCRHHDLP
jgi:Protein of unknown function (DUF2924)